MHRLLAAVRRLLLPLDEAQQVVAAAPTVPLREVWRRFWPYARPYRHWLWLALGFIILGPALDTAAIWMFKLLVDEVLVPRNFGPFVWIALAYFGLTLLSGLAGFADDYLSAWVAGRFLLSVRTAFFRHLQGLSLDFFERRPLGDVLSRLTGDIAAVESLLVSGVTAVLSYGLRIIFFAAVLLYLSWQLALLALFVAPVFWLVARYFSRLIKEAAREQRRRSGSISAIAQESLANVILVQAYNQQERESERFYRQGLGNFAARMASTQLQALFAPLTSLIELLGVLLVVGAGTWELTQGRLSLGGLLVFLAYLRQLYGPVHGLSQLANTVHSASASAERVIEFLDERLAVVERPHPVHLHRAQGQLTFDRVSFRYPGGEREALSGVSFQVRPGETLALVGPSGAGKTTIAKLVLRFYDPGAGRILLDGHDLRDLSLPSLRENIAVLLQDTLVFDGTIRENIAYGRPNATDEEIISAARAAGLHEFILSLPHGYEAIIGQRGQRLSGGQRQRVAIARAMIRNAPLLILDEPTTGLDAESGWRFLEAARRLMRGRTTIIISHNLMTVREASQIVVLEDGIITEAGRHADLLDLGGTYAHLYRRHHPDGRGRVPTGLESAPRPAIDTEGFI